MCVRHVQEYVKINGEYRTRRKIKGNFFPPIKHNQSTDEGTEDREKKGRGMA